MGIEYLIDTNTAIDYLDNKLPVTATNIIDTHEINLSVITRMELLVWPKSTASQILAIENFMDAGNVYQLEEPTILKAIEIRKKYRLKLPDAIIVATTIVNNLTLITRNEKDFAKIHQLSVINPWSI